MFQLFLIREKTINHFPLCSANHNVAIVKNKEDNEACGEQRKQLDHEFHETCHFVTFYFMKGDSKRCCDTTTPESIHTKDESKRGSAFAFIFGVN